MTILDDLEYKVERQFHYRTEEYTGKKYTTRLTFEHAFMITSEAEERGLEEFTYKDLLHKSKVNMKTMLLEAVLDIIEAEQITPDEKEAFKKALS